MPIRILFFADTHLGFDLPRNPRVVRRRRGHDFFANYHRILYRARTGGFDAVVHGGDVFFRSRVPPDLVQKAFRPLKQLADEGIPVLVVPGNHERSKIPYPWLAEHPGIFIFHKPRSVELMLRRKRIVFSGFPYAKSVRAQFSELVASTEWHTHAADAAFLCVHHCFEGATVGPKNHMFRHADDVIRHVDVPEGFNAVLSGHIHRHQVLTRDLTGKALRTPVFYPGSIERTSVAERGEDKGYLELTATPVAAGPVRLEWDFRHLPARQMLTSHFHSSEGTTAIRNQLNQLFRDVPRDAIVHLHVHGIINSRVARLFTVSHLRSLAPSSMNIEVRMPRPDAVMNRGSFFNTAGGRQPSGRAYTR